MPDPDLATPASADDLAANVSHGITQWFERSSRTSEEMLSDNSDDEPVVDLSIDAAVHEQLITVKTKITIRTPNIAMDYELGGQFQHPYSGRLPEDLVVEFAQTSAAPMLIGMIRDVVASESAIVSQNSILLPFHIERNLRNAGGEAVTMSDEGNQSSKDAPVRD